jgi:hypothetical protein
MHRHLDPAAVARRIGRTPLGGSNSRLSAIGSRRRNPPMLATPLMVEGQGLPTDPGWRENAFVELEGIAPDLIAR